MDFHTLTIPRERGLMASGQSKASDTSFAVEATEASANFGMCMTPFLEHAFKTSEFRVKVTINEDGSWGYEQDTVLLIRGQLEPFHHTDCNLLSRLDEPTPNPLARA